MAATQEVIRELLQSAGIELNGPAARDIQVTDDRFYRRVLQDGALGLGETYMDGWWECDALDEFIDCILRAGLESKVRGNWKYTWHLARAKLFNLQRRSRAHQIGEHHYD